MIVPNLFVETITLFSDVGKYQGHRFIKIKDIGIMKRDFPENNPQKKNSNGN